MLNRAFEWYRIVNAQPTSQTIDNRKAAVGDVVKAIDDAENVDLALSCAAAVVAGFENNFTQDSPLVKALVHAIRTHESAFPQDLSENALELRATAAIILGEIMARGGGDPDSLLIASVLQSGLGGRPAPKGKYLKQLLDDLREAAAQVVNSGALLRRREGTSGQQRLQKLAEPA